MTFEENENRKALKKLAAQACAGSQDTRSATGAAGASGSKAMFFVGATLVICLGWLTYSRWLHPADAPRETTTSTEAAVNSSKAALVASGASTSTPAIRAASAHESTSRHSADGAAATKSEMQSYDEHLEKRVAPLEDFARRGDPKAVPAVLDALHDDDWRVRSRAMDAAVNAYVPIPESALIDRAQSDPSPEVRFLALAGIAARIEPAIQQVAAIDPDTARSLSRLALSDSSEHVRWQAQQILDALDAGRAAPTEDQSQAAAL